MLTSLVHDRTWLSRTPLSGCAGGGRRALHAVALLTRPHVVYGRGEPLSSANSLSVSEDTLDEHGTRFRTRAIARTAGLVGYSRRHVRFAAVGPGAGRLGAELDRIELGVETPERQQVIVGAAFRDDAAIQYEDHVRPANGR